MSIMLSSYTESPALPERRVLCREFGISRKTGYKILHALQRDRPGRSHRSLAPALPPSQSARLFQIETQIVRLKQDKPEPGRA